MENPKMAAIYCRYLKIMNKKKMMIKRKCKTTQKKAKKKLTHLYKQQPKERTKECLFFVFIFPRGRSLHLTHLTSSWNHSGNISEKNVSNDCQEHLIFVTNVTSDQLNEAKEQSKPKINIGAILSFKSPKTQMAPASRWKLRPPIFTHIDPPYCFSGNFCEFFWCCFGVLSGEYTFGGMLWCTLLKTLMRIFLSTLLGTHLRPCI